jgi:hypothetical protein
MWPSPGAELRLVAESASFFAGDVPGLDRIPNYGDDDEATIRAQLAGWEMYVNNLFLLGILVSYFGTIILCRLIDPLNSTRWLPDWPGCCLD